MSGLSFDQVQQVHHQAQLAVLAMCARGLASAEFDANDEVMQVVLTVERPGAGQSTPTIDVQFLGLHSVPLGGMGL